MQAERADREAGSRRRHESAGGVGLISRCECECEWKVSSSLSLSLVHLSRLACSAGADGEREERRCGMPCAARRCVYQVASLLLLHNLLPIEGKGERES